MKFGYKLTFLIAVFSTAIVVFNNLTDIAKKVLSPNLNKLYLISFLVIVLPAIWYTYYNWRLKK